MIRHKFKYFLDTANISLLTLIPIIAALLFLGGVLNILEKGFHIPITDPILGISGAIFAYIGCLSPLVQIYRRESPGFMSYFGCWPVASGIIGFVFIFCLGTLSLIYGILGLIK